MTEKITWKSEKRKIGELKPFEGNPRQANEKEVADLDKSLDRFSLADPLVINTDGTVIGGNFRLSRLTAKGIKDVDVRVPSRTLNRKESEELNLRLNKNQGSWDFGVLANFSEEMLKDVGWGSEELDEIFEMATAEDDFDVESEYEKIKEPKTKRGELYQLGDHRLLCGDSTKKEEVDKLMGGVSAKMVFTDPPYNMDYISKKHGKILGDNQTEEKFIEFSVEFIQRMKEALRAGGTFYICSGYGSYIPFVYAMNVAGLEFANPIVWVKNSLGMGMNDYRHKHEMLIKAKKGKKKKGQPILYGWKKGKHYFKEVRQEADVWEIKRRATNTLVHPTQKPLELISRAIRNSSKRDDIILDLFGGSGSTLIAAEKEGRKCYMMELDPKYCDVIINRWESYTKKKAQKIK